MDTLYDVLRVAADATPEEITAAYRTLAKALHPDRNPGDEDAAAQYHRVDEAYQVLSDPVRRAEYDETGRSDARREGQQELMLILIPVMMQAIQDAEKLMEGVEYVNLVDLMRKILFARVRTMESARKEMLEGKETLEQVLKRIAVKDDANVFAVALEGQIRQIDLGLARWDLDRDRVRKATEYLEHASYSVSGGDTDFAGNPFKSLPGAIWEVS